jgi:Arc/MetJ-type ribon-helix-helix transcriptional regulator
MTIHLPPNLESEIRGAVHRGRYASVDDAMAEAVSLLVRHLETEQSQAIRRGRLAIAIALGTLAWAFGIGFATFGFSQKTTGLPLKNHWEEILYFAYAFAVASAITGVVACASAGKKRWAIGACATNIVLLAASLQIVQWLIYGKLAPNGPLAELSWDFARDCAKFGSVLGIGSAAIVSGLVMASIVVERHTKRWQFGLIVAVMVAVLGLWLLPDVAYGLPELAAPYIGLKYAQLHNTSLFAAGMTGAGSGALAGAVVAGLMARWLHG